MTPQSRERLNELIAVNKLFAALSEDDRSTLLARGQQRLVVAGTILMREGEIADWFFILTSGEVEIRTGTEHQLLARLRSLTIIGETAIFARLKRTATVVAATDLSMIVFEQSSIEQLLNGQPELRARLAQLALDRAADTVKTLIGT